MPTYRIDETVVRTENATQDWSEKTDFDGQNNISRATGNQWTHQRLYRSRKGRYYVVHTSQWQGSRDSVEWVSKEEAARWLLLMEHDLPDELKEAAENVSE